MYVNLNPTVDARREILMNMPRSSHSHSTTTVTSTSTSTSTVTSTQQPPATPTQNYTRGLDGTDQPGNYFFINALLIFFALLGVILLSIRIYKLAWNHIRKLFASGSGDSQNHFASNNTTFWPWAKRHILYAPLWKNRHNKEIQISSAVSIGTLPSRMHFLILVAYAVSNIVYCVYLQYDQERTATLAELRGRSGALATFNLIPTFLFALRGNPLIPMLRVSYDTFNLFHRGLARIVIVESIIHVAAWASTCVIESGSSLIGKSIVAYPSLQWGTSGVVIFMAMGMLAWSPFRHAFYEAFINMHKLFAFAALLGVLQHLRLSGLPQIPYVVLAGIFWGGDILYRLGSLWYYNYGRNRRTTVMVEALPNEACRVTLDLARPWRYRPGAHVHLYLPSIGLWSSHPFSLAWSEDRHLVNFDDKEDVDSKISADMDLDCQAKIKTTVSLLVKARSGMTRKLYERAAASPNRVLSLAGAMEGPYAGHESLDSYGTVVLFAGGVGITHQLGYVRHLVEGYDARTVAARRVLLVWCIPEMDNLEWVRPWMDEILKMKNRKDVLRIQIHITKGTVNVTSKTGTVIMSRGRCNIKQTVDEEFLERQGAMVVTVCGPGAFADDVRFAVRKRVQLGCVDFIEESFAY